MKILSTNLYSQTVRARELTFCEKVHLPPPVMRHESHIMCHISCVMCHISCVICHVSCVLFNFGTQWWSEVVKWSVSFKGATLSSFSQPYVVQTARLLTPSVILLWSFSSNHFKYNQYLHLLCLKLSVSGCALIMSEREGRQTDGQLHCFQLIYFNWIKI